MKKENVSKIKPVNYKDYPECMFAIISAYLPSYEGNDIRWAAGKVVFRHIDKYGNTYKNGLHHSYEDKPALVEEYLDEEGHRLVWYKDGDIHRDGDLPAVIDIDRQEWYKDGKRHREGDKPAWISRDTHQWFENDELHRLGDKPCYIGFTAGYYQWKVNGSFYREGDKPSLIIEISNTKWWHNKDGKLHRDGDLPAKIEGQKREWYQNGFCHRDNDKPAVFDPHNGIQVWYKNGLRHREGGKPALIQGMKSSYYLNGNEVKVNTAEKTTTKNTKAKVVKETTKPF